MTLTVDVLRPEEDAAIERFLDEASNIRPSVVAYAYPFFREVLCALNLGEPLYLGARRGGQLVGLVPGFLRRDGASAAYCSLPFFGPNGGALVMEEGASAVETKTSLLTRLFECCARIRGLLTASVYTPFLDGDFQPYDAVFPEATVVTERFTQYLDLESACWPADVRYDIRKAQRAGVVTRPLSLQTDLDRLLEMYEENCLRQGIPGKPRPAIERLLSDPLAAGHVGAWVAELNGEVAAALIVLWSRRTASYYLPCATNRGRGVQAPSLLIDRAVDEARARGVRWWNWESSPSRESGVYRFKRKWGSSESSYRVYTARFVEEAELRALGRAEIGRRFPYYFVYPFDRVGGLASGRPDGQAAR